MPRSVVTPGVGTAAVLTLPATEGMSYGILSIVASYSGLVTGGSLIVAIGGTTKFNVDLNGNSPFIFEEDISGDVGDGMVITLTGVLLATGKLNVNYSANL